MAKQTVKNTHKGLSALLEKGSKNKVDSKIKQYDPETIYPKTIHLKGSVLNVLERLAAEDKRKIKPFMENQLEDLAKGKK